MMYDEADQRLVRRDMIVPKGGGTPREYRAALQEYRPSEIPQLLESLGVMEIAFYGDACAAPDRPLFSLEGFNERSHVMIVSGRKRVG
jgi:hypothetical protein